MSAALWVRVQEVKSCWGRWCGFGMGRTMSGVAAVVVVVVEEEGVIWAMYVSCHWRAAH